MSHLIEASTNQRNIERVGQLNHTAETEEQATKVYGDKLMGQLAHRERQRAQDTARIQMEAELHKAERDIRARYDNALELPPPAHPEDAQAAQHKGIMRRLLRDIKDKADN